MSKDENDPQKAKRNLGGKNGDRASQSNERRQPKDTRFKKGRSGNDRGRPPKKIEVREHDNPATHHLMKHVKVTGAKGKVIEGRFLDLMCMRLATMALNGNFKALDKLIEIAGGPLNVAIMSMDIYRSERLRGDDPDPDEGGSGPDGPNPEEGGSGPNSLSGGPTVQVTEDNLDSSESGEPDEGDQRAERTRYERAGRDPVDVNDETIWNRVKAVGRRLSDQRSAAKEAKKISASERKRVGSSKRKEETIYFRDGKLIDDSDAIIHSLMDPNYWSDPGYLPYDCPTRLARMRAKYALHLEQVECEKRSTGSTTKEKLKAEMAAPEIQEITGGEPRCSPTADGIEHDQESNESQDDERIVPTSDDNKRRHAVGV